MSNPEPMGETRRRPKPFQYSLRRLLLLIGILSAGMWYWWHRPFEIEVVITAKASSPPPAHIDSWTSTIEDPFFVFSGAQPDPFDAIGYHRREVRTVRRSGWKDVIRHGPSLVYNQGGRKVFEETWQADRRHGPYRMWDKGGQLIVSGQFNGGEKHGKWTTWHAAGNMLREQEFENGKPVGTWVEYTTKTPAGKKWKETSYEEGKLVNETYYRYVRDGFLTATVDFDDGKPVGVEGESVEEFTKRLAEAPSGIQTTLDREAQLQFDDATLDEVVALLREQELHEIPISINNRALASSEFDFDQRFSDQLNGIPLRLGLLLFLRRCGLVCDYRFEQLVITTADDARTWTDRSGVKDLQPPPGSRWARALDDETGVEFYEVSDMVDELKNRYGVKIRLGPRLRDSTPRESTTAAIHTVRMPLRYWLRILLGRENLTCELDGDTLLIRPLEN
jgi:antitoxin component YwqK of YwqJK toxin-antitoxin module